MFSAAPSGVGGVSALPVQRPAIDGVQSLRSINKLAVAAQSALAGSWTYKNGDQAAPGTVIFSGTDASLKMSFDRGAIYSGHRSGTTVSFQTSNNQWRFIGSVTKAEDKITGTFTYTPNGKTTTGVFTRTNAKLHFVTAPNKDNAFLIAASPAPKMPTIQLDLQNLPAGSSDVKVNWTSKLHFETGSYVKDYVGQAKTLTANQTYSAEFSGFAGGTLIVTATYTIGGKTTTLSTATDSVMSKTQVRGANPSLEQITSYVTAKGIPALAKGSSPTFSATVSKIIFQESSNHQFLPGTGMPYMNTTGDGGVGLMQLTNGNRSDTDFWNWQTNIDHGFNLLAGNLTVAQTNFNNSAQAPVKPLFADLKAKYKVTTLTFEKPTATHLLYNAVSKYGPNSHYFYKYVDSSGNPSVRVSSDGKSGVIELHEVPIADDYVYKIF